MITLTHTQRVLLGTIAVILFACLWFLFTWASFLRAPIVFNDQGMEYTVPEGASIRSVVHDLYLLNVIKRPTFFYLLVYFAEIIRRFPSTCPTVRTRCAIRTF